MYVITMKVTMMLFLASDVHQEIRPSSIDHQTQLQNSEECSEYNMITAWYSGVTLANLTLPSPDRTEGAKTSQRRTTLLPQR